MTRITQETFDQVVEENISEFDMDADEACRDAVTQFEAQGVDLSTIITTPRSADGHADENDDSQVVVGLLDELKAIDPDALDADTAKGWLSQIDAALSTEPDSKSCPVAAGHGGVIAVVALTHKCDTDVTVGLNVLQKLLTVADARDQLGPAGVAATVAMLDAFPDDNSTLDAILRTLIIACTTNELNRQKAVVCGLVEKLLALLTSTAVDGRRPVIVSTIANMMATLTLQDDKRAAVPRGNDHVADMAKEGAFAALLAVLALPAVATDAPEAAAVLTTLASLAIRNDYCQELLDGGVFERVYELAREHAKSAPVARAVCVLLRALSGNDACKNAMCQGDGLAVVLSVVEQHQRDVVVVEQAVAALATMVLRQPSNAARAHAAGAHRVVLASMNVHPEHALTQRWACMFLRNLVARNRDLAPSVLEEGAEQLVRRARRDHRRVCEDAAKAALRDLNLDVKLACPFVGKQGSLLHDE